MDFTNFRIQSSLVLVPGMTTPFSHIGGRVDNRPAWPTPSPCWMHESFIAHRVWRRRDGTLSTQCVPPSDPRGTVLLPALSSSSMLPFPGALATGGTPCEENIISGLRAHITLASHTLSGCPMAVILGTPELCPLHSLNHRASFNGKGPP